MEDVTGHEVTSERPYLLMALGAIGVLGCVVASAGILIADAVVPGQSMFADTISDLGAGRMEWIVDIALYFFAAGLVAMALAAAHAHLGGIAWSCGILGLAVLAAIVVVVGARNEYGDGDSEGVVIHAYLVYALGALVLGIPLAMAGGIGNSHGRARWALVGLAVLWAVAAPGFFLVPTSVDGLYERGLGLILCAIVCVLAWVFWTRGRRAHNRLDG